MAMKKNIHVVIMGLLIVVLSWFIYQIVVIQKKTELYKNDVATFAAAVENKNYSEALSQIPRIESYSLSNSELIEAAERIRSLKSDLISLETRQKALELDPVEFLSNYFNAQYTPVTTYLDIHNEDMMMEYETKAPEIVRDFLTGNTFYEYDGHGGIDYDKFIKISEDGNVNYLSRMGKIGQIRVYMNKIEVFLLNLNGDEIYEWGIWDIESNVIDSTLYTSRNGQTIDRVYEASEYIKE
ncbi:hypothetical protein HO913_04065 [Streptococcus suis]|nr:hypothetical protein [Streptococcus suis]HEL1557337.1 hypothetical protein [Streptococcus suis]HEM3177467.1 hypothetical protein [Streptococcus suis]